MSLPVVSSATLLPLLDCNARCPFCSTRLYTDRGIFSAMEPERRAKDCTLPLEELKGRLDDLRARGVTRLNIQGGEPTLHEGLPELVRHGWALGFEEQTVVTNGRRLREEAIARALVESAPSTIVLSIFGDRAREHDHSMGVRGAFDDLLEAVHVLLRCGAGRPRRRPSLMAQFTLHAANHARLGEMVRFWYGVGLRDFSVRLLRETGNTRRDATDWFFDLAALRQPLVGALDWLAARRDASISFSELPYCLLPDDRIAHVLRDVGTNPNPGLQSVKLASRVERTQAPRRGRSSSEACASCGVSDACIGLDREWQERFSADLRPLNPVELLSRLLRDRPAQARPSVAALLRDRSVLPPELERGLRLWLADETLLSERTIHELRSRLGSHPRALRFVPASRAGLRAPFPEALSAALRPGPVRDALERLTFVSSEPLCAVWLHLERFDNRQRVVLTWLHDDELAPETIVTALSEAL